MPIYELQIKANLENVTALRPSEPKFHQWALKFQCSGCRELSDKFRYVSAEELQDLPNTRGQAHYFEKCGFCGKFFNLTIQEDSFKSVDESEKFFTVVKFECRGAEPKELEVSGDWECESTLSEAKFTQIDLSESWADYDEKGGEPVTIDDLEWRFK